MVLKVKVSPELIGGDVNEGYGKVADVFRRNISSGQEIGAAFAVYRDGVKVVDLWGGYRNGITKVPWQEDTLVMMMSTTKGVSSLAVAVAASRGLDLVRRQSGRLLAGVRAGWQRGNHGAAASVASSRTARH